MHIGESDLDNILVHQKDNILRLINAEDWDKAIFALEVVEELWIATGYGYKGFELSERIHKELCHKLDGCGHRTTHETNTVRREKAVHILNRFYQAHVDRTPALLV